jgi:hypothetical protein
MSADHAGRAAGLADWVSLSEGGRPAGTPYSLSAASATPAAQVYAALAVADAIRDLIAEVANLAEGLAEAREALAAEVENLAAVVDCTPARPARRPWRRRPAGGAA